VRGVEAQLVPENLRNLRRQEPIYAPGTHTRPSALHIRLPPSSPLTLLSITCIFVRGFCTIFSSWKSTLHIIVTLKRGERGMNVSGHNLRSKGKLTAEHAAGHRPSDEKGDSAGAAAPLPLSKADFPHIRQAGTACQCAAICASKN